MTRTTASLPLISVVIATYNYAAFLPIAVQSVLNQTYPNVEIIIVDDGSNDNTKLVIQKTWPVTYIYQENRGLSAARNAGFSKSSGKFIVFLDADDWLETDALEKNCEVIKGDPQLAFVSGNYYLLHAGCSHPKPISVSVEGCYYQRLLQSNYIGMHAAVMYRRWVLQEFQFDENLKACEDYDLYLSITRKYPVRHHRQFIATYYFHAAGMSHNYKLMRDAIITVLKKQAPLINTAQEAQAYKKGLLQSQDYDNLLKINV